MIVFIFSAFDHHSNSTFQKIDPYSSQRWMNKIFQANQGLTSILKGREALINSESFWPIQTQKVLRQVKEPSPFSLFKERSFPRGGQRSHEELMNNFLSI